MLGLFDSYCADEVGQYPTASTFETNDAITDPSSGQIHGADEVPLMASL